MSLRDEILEQPEVAARFLRARPGGRRAARRGDPRARRRPRRHRGPRHERPRRDLRAVRARRPARPVGRARDAVGHLAVRRAAAARSLARRRHQPVGRVAGRRRRHRRRPPPGCADAGHHQRSRPRRWPTAAETTIDLGAGPELAIAATKTYTTELLAIAALSAAMSGDPADTTALAGDPRRAWPRRWRSSRASSRWPPNRPLPIACSSSRAATSTRPRASGRSSSRSSPGSSPTRTRRPTSSTGRWRCSSPAFRSSQRSARVRRFASLVALVDRLRTDLAADVAVVSDADEALALARWPFRLPAGTPEWLGPIVSIVVGQLHALHLTRARGPRPGGAAQPQQGDAHALTGVAASKAGRCAPRRAWCVGATRSGARSPMAGAPAPRSCRRRAIAHPSGPRRRNPGLTGAVRGVTVRLTTVSLVTTSSMDGSGMRRRRSIVRWITSAVATLAVGALLGLPRADDHHRPFGQARGPGGGRRVARRPPVHHGLHRRRPGEADEPGRRPPTSAARATKFKAEFARVDPPVHLGSYNLGTVSLDAYAAHVLLPDGSEDLLSWRVLSAGGRATLCRHPRRSSHDRARDAGSRRRAARRRAGRAGRADRADCATRAGCAEPSRHGRPAHDDHGDRGIPPRQRWLHRGARRRGRVRAPTPARADGRPGTDRPPGRDGRALRRRRRPGLREVPGHGTDRGRGRGDDPVDGQRDDRRSRCRR